MIARFQNSGVAAVVGRDFGPMAVRSAPAWRTAPPVRRVVPAPESRTPGRRRLVRSIWIRPEGESLGEKVWMGFLAVAGVVGIGYGFSCLLDLVQHWASVATGISGMIQ